MAELIEAVGMILFVSGGAVWVGCELVGWLKSPCR